jgi:hypothetical protein
MNQEQNIQQHRQKLARNLRALLEEKEISEITSVRDLIWLLEGQHSVKRYLIIRNDGNFTLTHSYDPNVDPATYFGDYESLKEFFQSGQLAVSNILDITDAFNGILHLDFENNWQLVKLGGPAVIDVPELDIPY